MNKLIYRKFNSDCVNFFILCLISIALIIWVIQAVNFLDIVVEDGHGFKVYFLYTLLNLPKILSRILPFIYFLTLIYILLKYENNNELIIFWTIGISKINFVKNLLRLTIYFILFQIFLTTVIVPKSQDIARSYIRSSNIEFFGSAIKAKKFIDTTKNLTIFVEEKNINGDMKNVYLKDDLGNNNHQIIYAKKGRYEGNTLYLESGKIINSTSNKMNNFDFYKTEFNISKFSTKSTMDAKTQENQTLDLIKCVWNAKTLNDSNESYLFSNCRKNNLKHIFQELQKRILNPFYLLNLALAASLLIVRSKENYSFSRYKITVFIIGVILIIFSEISLKAANSTLALNLGQISLPIIIFIFTYLFLKKKLLLISNNN